MHSARSRLLFRRIGALNCSQECRAHGREIAQTPTSKERREIRIFSCWALRGDWAACLKPLASDVGIVKGNDVIAEDLTGLTTLAGD